MLKYCPTDLERRGGNAAPASQVFHKFWVTSRHKKLCVFHFKSTINRKQSRVKYVKSAVQVAEPYPDDLRGFPFSVPPRPGSRHVHVLGAGGGGEKLE